MPPEMDLDSLFYEGDVREAFTYVTRSIRMLFCKPVNDLCHIDILSKVMFTLSHDGSWY